MGHCLQTITEDVVACAAILARLNGQPPQPSQRQPPAVELTADLSVSEHPNVFLKSWNFDSQVLSLSFFLLFVFIDVICCLLLCNKHDWHI